jgi:replication-associated recombination protein RarA
MSQQHFEDKYSPKSLSEVIFPNQHTEIVLKGYESGENLCPHLLFHGPSGSGKTTVAKLIYGALLARGDDGYTDPLENLLNMQNDGAIYQVSWRRSFGYDNRTIVLKDEIDELSEKQQNKLAHLMDCTRETMLVIATTNYFYKIERKLISRFQCYEFPKLTAAAFAPRAIHILNSEGHSCNLNFANKVLKKFENTGDIRDYCRYLKVLSDHQPKSTGVTNSGSPQKIMPLKAIK